MKGLPEDAWQHLIRVTDRCIGCGICEKVCPSGSIHVETAGQSMYLEIVRLVLPVRITVRKKQSV